MLACSGDGPLRTAFQRGQVVLADRHGHAEARPGARGERGRGGRTVPVAQVVDEQLAEPVGNLPNKAAPTTPTPS